MKMLFIENTVIDCRTNLNMICIKLKNEWYWILFSHRDLFTTFSSLVVIHIRFVVIKNRIKYVFDLLTFSEF